MFHKSNHHQGAGRVCHDWRGRDWLESDGHWCQRSPRGEPQWYQWCGQDHARVPQGKDHSWSKDSQVILQATVEWFKIYKMPDGKPANEFAFNAEPKNKEFAENIIAGTHESWKKLMRWGIRTKWQYIWICLKGNLGVRFSYWDTLKLVRNIIPRSTKLKVGI